MYRGASAYFLIRITLTCIQLFSVIVIIDLCHSALVACIRDMVTVDILNSLRLCLYSPLRYKMQTSFTSAHTEEDRLFDCGWLILCNHSMSENGAIILSRVKGHNLAIYTVQTELCLSVLCCTSLVLQCSVLLRTFSFYLLTIILTFPTVYIHIPRS